MATKRTRDSVWDAALTKTVAANSAIDVDELVDELPASERTIREVLQVMVDSHHLEKVVKPDGSHLFIASDRYQTSLSE